MNRELQARIDRLEAENRVLREENLLLAEHAEEAMLLRTIAEVAGWSNDQDTLLYEVLERFSILRDIPLCACGQILDHEIRLPWSYSSHSEGDCSVSLQVPADLFEKLGGRNGSAVQLPSPGYRLSSGDSDLEVCSLFLMTFSTHSMPRGIFLFACTDRDRNWAGPQISLRQAVDTVAARLDRLDLVAELQSMNQELDLRVRERTTELQLSNRDLGRLQALLENVINSMPSVLIAIDDEGRVLQWNQEACRLSGCSAEEARGQLLSEVFPGLHRQLPGVEKAISSRQVQRSSRVLTRLKPGSQMLMDVTSYPLLTNGVIGAVIRADDVTDRVRLEEAMIQAEKMLSVGGLAAGMAHEINNPLAGIMQNLQVAQNRLTLTQSKNLAAAAEFGLKLEAVTSYLEKRGVLDMLRSATESARRAAAIVDNILSFSRQSESKKSPRDLARLIEQTLALLDNDYDLEKGYDFRKIKIVRDFEAGLPQVPCEETKIQQVLLNILRNGAQAMRSHEAQDECCFVLKLSRHGEMAQIEICDNGPGLEPEVRRRIFEPFFTTKGVRGGTGLGLSVSYFIVAEQHGGQLSVEPTTEHGCCFVIRLPFESS